VAVGATASENPSLYCKSKSEGEERKKEERVRGMEVERRWVGGWRGRPAGRPPHLGFIAAKTSFFSPFRIVSRPLNHQEHFTWVTC
jgi:hypothetical protein